jgi:hypothetical protein
MGDVKRSAPGDSEQSFELFLASLVPQLVDGSSLGQETGDDSGIDLIVEGPSGVLLIEAKRDTPATRIRLDLVSEQLLRSVEKYRGGRPIRAVLAIPGVLSEENRELLAAREVELWDGPFLVDAARKAGIAEPQDVKLAHTTIDLVKSPGQFLRKRLRGI